MKFRTLFFFAFCLLWLPEVYAAPGEEVDRLWEEEAGRRRALETLKSLAGSLNGFPEMPEMNQTLMIPDAEFKNHESTQP